jgi:hypothetical protein
MIEPPAHFLEHALACTAPIYKRRLESQAVHVGSGVILALSSRYFLFTAAHVLDGLYVEDRPHVGVGSALVPMDIRVTRSRTNVLGRQADRIDMGVVEVDVARLGLINVPGLHPRSVDIGDAAYDDHIFRLIGYPNEVQRSTISANNLEVTSLQLNVVSQPTPVDPRTGRLIHLSLRYDPASVTSGGQRIKATRLRGCSGGGLWRWDSNGALMLTALLTDHDRKARQLRGTRMSVAVDALRHVAPELVYHFA